MEKINKLSQTEIDLLNEEQKRNYFIQVQQEDTMIWQKQAAQIQVFVFWISLIIVGGWVLIKFMNKDL